MAAQVHHDHDPAMKRQSISIKIEVDNPEDNTNPIDWQTLRSIVSEINETFVDSIYSIPKDTPTPRDHTMMNMIMDTYYLGDNKDYKDNFNSKLPQLHENIIPIFVRNWLI